MSLQNTMSGSQRAAIMQTVLRLSSLVNLTNRDVNIGLVQEVIPRLNRLNRMIDLAERRPTRAPAPVRAPVRAVTPPARPPPTQPPAIQPRAAMRVVRVEGGQHFCCSRCGGAGHNRNNRACPLFATQPDQRVRIVRTLTPEEIIERERQRMNVERSISQFRERMAAAENRTQQVGNAKPCIRLIQNVDETVSQEPEDCPICLDCPAMAQRVKSNCSHEFCVGCVIGMIRNTPTRYIRNTDGQYKKIVPCPMCRAEIVSLNCMAAAGLNELTPLVA
jgi:hypothetical protein